MSRADLDALLNALLPFAQEALSKHGEFYPFGASMNHAGEISASMAYDGDEHPSSQDVIALLRDAFRHLVAGSEIRAAGICYDVRVAPPGSEKKTDAIQAELEHQDGEALDVFLPYRKGFLGRLKYGDLFAGKGELTIFDRSDAT